jgi:polyvinyl alcohol dehydrogenase (cytochrome)
MCDSHPPIAASTGDWATAAVSAASDRFQRNPGLSAADIPKLKLKWAYTMPGGGQPIVVGDWLFMTNRGAKSYALDARTGCMHWALEGASSRTAPLIVRSSISPSGWATFIGVGARVVRAIDAQTGKDIWKSESLDSHPASGITGSLVVAGEQIFVPITSGEEGAAAQKSYVCCSFRGSLVALDLKTGKTQWKTYTITEPLQPTRKTADGKQLQGPAGAAIWASPTIDEKRGLVYVVTGDSYTDADTKGADAVMAIEMQSGKVRWSNQVTEKDNFVMGCGNEPTSNSCPEPVGPDFDFGATPILFSLKGGKQVLIAGQKSGLVYGMDPDTGKLLWKTRVGNGSALGGVEWGIGADDKYVFVPNADTVLLFDEVRRRNGQPTNMPGNTPPKPGVSAIDPATGKIVWNVPAPIAPCKYSGDRSRDYTSGECVRAQSAAPAVIPGVVFSGTLDGWMRAYDAKTGKIIWDFSSTAQIYDTVNGIKNQPGGGIDGMGPTVAHGMVYFMSGFNGASRTGGNGNNVLLAFSVDGK